MRNSFLAGPSSLAVEMAGPSSSSRPTNSDDPHYNPTNKKRKIDRACDACRRRKTKCDGPKMRDNICTNCLQSRKSCTYVETSKPRGPPKAYVTGLEDRLEKMEELLKSRWPDTDFSDELGPPVVIGCWKADSSTPGPSSSGGGGVKRDDSPAKSAPLANKTGTLFAPSVPLGFSSHLMLSPPASKSRRSQGKARQSSADDNEPICIDPGSDVDELVEDFKGKMHLSLPVDVNSADENNTKRFHGSSCSLRLMDATRKYKHLHAVESGSNGGNSPTPSLGPHSLRRPECWRPPKWEMLYEGLHISRPEILPQVLSQFPPPDLCDTLIRLYFQHVNSQFPLLHRPTFERQWQQSLHERNMWFACLVMTLFSVASRWCDDLRVLPKSITKQENGDIDWTRAGWDYFDVAFDIHRHRRSLIYPATLFEIQGFSLLAMFLRGTNSHALSWHITSVGIRKAQDVGAHRKTVYHAKANGEEELWKRAFWLLVGFDRIGSATLGRTCNVGEEDFDIDLPLEVDDEYWEAEEPSRAFRQPPGVPSRITAFNLWLKLTQIIAFTMRTIYATNPAKVIMGRPIGKPEQIVSQINAALTEWVDSVPDTFKWSGHGQDDLTSNLSATLYTTYYLTQMLIYRPFIPAPMSKNSTFPFPALSICTNAARSSARIIEEQLQQGLWNVPNLNAVSIVSASMLLVHVWDLKHKDRNERENGMEIDPPISSTLEPLLKDINIFIRALEWSSHRYEVVKPVLAQLKLALPQPEDDERPAGHSSNHPVEEVSFDMNQPSSSPDTDMEHSQELVWNGAPSPPPILRPPSHVRSGSTYSMETRQPPPPPRSASSDNSTPLSSASLSGSATPLSSSSFYEQSFYRPDERTTYPVDSRYPPVPQSRRAQTHPQNQPVWRSRSHIPRIASYQRMPHSSPAYPGRAPFIESSGLTREHVYDMDDDRPPSHYMDDEDDMKPIYQHGYSHPPISDARSIPAHTISPNDGRTLRPPPGWDRQARQVNKSTNFGWDSHPPHRPYHDYSPPLIPHTS